jgi:hypothetical protein
MRKLALCTALFALLGILPAPVGLAHEPGEAPESAQPGQRTDPHDLTRESAEDRRVAETVRQAIGEAAKDVTITASDGVVVLRGFVPSQAERERIVAAAGKPDGVTQVDDQLQIVEPHEAAPPPASSDGP